MSRHPVTNVTPAQEAMLPQARDEWLAAVLSTERADRPRAERAVLAMYEEIGEPRPIVIWLGSPLAGAVGAELCSAALRRRHLLARGLGDQVKDRLGWKRPPPDWWEARCRRWQREEPGDPLWHRFSCLPEDSGEASLWAQCHEQLGDQLHAKLAIELRQPLRVQLERIADPLGGWLEAECGRIKHPRRYQRNSPTEDRLEEQVRDQLRDQFDLLHPPRGEIGNRLQEQLRDRLPVHELTGHREADWVACYDFARQWGVRYGERSARWLAWWVDYVRSAGWMWPLRGAVILTERPLLLSRDEHGRPHSDTGPAVRYRDGWAGWAVHGVRVPERVVTRKLTVADISIEPSLEVRRGMLERLGAQRYIRETGAQLEHEDERGRLWRVARDGDENLVMVEAALSTTAGPDAHKSCWLFTAQDLNPSGLMLRFGTERYMRATGARLEHDDGLVRVWRLPRDDEEDLVLVELWRASASLYDDFETGHWEMLPAGSSDKYWRRLDEVEFLYGVELRRLVRQVVLAFGAERYMRARGARLEHEDECGLLWRVAQHGDEDLVMVEVVNATAEPDGSHSSYWLRVPPETRTGREAVAWTFDVSEDYRPAVET